MNEAKDCGFSLLGVVARESIPTGWTYRKAAAYYSGYPLDAIEVGNEPDLRSPSSWTMPPNKFQKLLGAFDAHVDPYTSLVSGGLASGNPHYLDAINLSGYSATGIHPYGKRPSVESDAYGPGLLPDLLASYASYRPLWVTEFGSPQRDWVWPDDPNVVYDEVGRGQYLVDMVNALDGNVDVVICFSWHDVDGFGLTDSNGNLREAGRMYLEAVDNVS